MKFLFGFVLALMIGNVATADVPSTDLVKVTRVLASNPQISMALAKAGTTHLVDIAIISQDSQNHYTLKFIRACECLPAETVVTVDEDLRPTHVDGPPRYTVEIKTTAQN